MATISNLKRSQIGSASPKIYSRLRSTIESAFYRNNVIEVKSIKQAYELAKNCPGTIVTDLPVVNAEKLGLDKDARVLLFNDGFITGRQARLRKLVDDSNRDSYAGKVREILFSSCRKTFYHATAYIGLDPEFMVRAHLMVPQGFENTLYSWLLNFQNADDPEAKKMYEKSKLIDEGDIFIYSDPDCYPAEFKDGLALFDSEFNCACLLGMRYFGEHKKGTLTLGWSIAQRHGYTACHGGQKRFNLEEGKQKVISVFGLSGSGKSTITLSDHGGKMNTTVLHDDAFIINNSNGSSISLEPSYFDKTQDYPLTRDQSKYFLTIQNCGATLDDEGKIVPVTEDILNGNGRTVKSKFAAMNREYAFAKSTDAIFWIMKDSSLPPVLKVNSPALASAMGATLATKRSTAEYVPGEDPNKLVIVPYANPFRLYPLSKDYYSFKSLFENLHVDCYIINTGFFKDIKVTPKVTLGLIEDIVNDKASFKQFGPFSELEYYDLPGYPVDFSDKEYAKEVKNRLQDRLNFVANVDEFNKLPDEALEALKKVISEIE
ncbi:MAG: phosphoenolpyruvate carboxykinase (ATP) [Candidatus Onthovivens sp.]|nr:phosphoenolpyruvate carboxykinase (ATP) [Candidatus Onthovivens sp.]